MTLYFLDLILMIFFIQLVYLSSLNYFGVFKKFFLTLLENVFGLEKKLPLSSFLSSMIFLLLLILCFLSYFSYSFCICGMIEFTFFFALVSWLSTFIVFINSESFSVYMSKSGDNFLKTLSMFLVELVSEFSRPVALTVRLTVNIMVGHLVSMMLFNLLELSSGYFYSWLLIFAIMMECIVFFIQSYIFSRLLFLYLNE